MQEMIQDLEYEMLDSILSIEQIRKFQSRADFYDSDIDLFRDDFETLQAMGYLIQVVPEDLGGLGLSFNEACHQQRRLAKYAPTLAKTVKGHIFWTGIAADLWSQGDSSLEWVLDEACAGGVISVMENKNVSKDSVVTSNLKIEYVDGGYCFTGQGNICCLPPNLGRLGLHGIDESEPGNIKTIYALMPLNTQGLVIGKNSINPEMNTYFPVEVILDAAFVSDKYITRKISKDSFDADPFALSTRCWGQLCSNVN